MRTHDEDSQKRTSTDPSIDRERLWLPPSARATSFPSSRTARWGSAWCLGLGGVATLVGGRDVLFAAQLPFRIAGAAVLLLGVALVAAFVGFRRRAPWRYSWAVAAGTAAAIFGVLLCFAQWVADVRDVRIVVWLGIVLASAALAVAAAREGAVKLSSYAQRRVQVVSSVLSLGVVLSIAQFWNAAVRVPPTSAPSLSIATELEQVPDDGKLTRVHATVRLRNTASSKIWVLGSLYNLFGGTTPLQKMDDDQYIEWMTDNLRRGVTGYGLSRHAAKTYTRVMETGRLLDALTYLVPGEEYSFHLAFHVPQGRYDLLRLETRVAIAKDTLVLEDDPARRLDRDRERNRRVAVTHPIRETSWLGRIVRGSRELHTDVVVYVDGGYRIPYLVAYVDHAGAAPSYGESAFSERMHRLYGIAFASSWSELALRDKLPPD